MRIESKKRIIKKERKMILNEEENFIMKMTVFKQWGVVVRGQKIREAKKKNLNDVRKEKRVKIVGVVQ